MENVQLVMLIVFGVPSFLLAMFVLATLMASKETRGVFVVIALICIAFGAMARSGM